jgi:hypothetical protein
MPAMQATTNFVDGVVVHQGDLNNLSTNINTLCQQTTGKTPAQAASSKPITQVDLNATQSISDTVITLISWNLASTSITDTIWVASAPTVLTIVTPGWYSMDLQVCWANGTMNNRVIGMMVNGTTPTANSIAEVNAGNSTTVTLFKHRCTAYAHLNQGATVYAYCLQTSGGAINLNPNSVAYPGTFMSVRWDAP